MRLWHENLIPHLDRQRLLSQHRECAALRGLGWGRKHSTVDWAFKYGKYRLYMYHVLVMDEMKRRGYKPNLIWYNPLYQGKRCELLTTIEPEPLTQPVYPEHDSQQLLFDLKLLKSKNVPITADFPQTRE